MKLQTLTDGPFQALECILPVSPGTQVIDESLVYGWGFPLCALRAPLPSLGVSGGSGHVLPLEGALRPQSWGLCAWNPASSVPARPVGHPPIWCLEALALPGQDGGGQALPVGLDCTYVNSANPTPHFYNCD